MKRFFIVSQAYRDGLYAAKSASDAERKFAAEGDCDDTFVQITEISRHDISLAAHEKPAGGSLAETVLWLGF